MKSMVNICKSCKHYYGWWLDKMCREAWLSLPKSKCKDWKPKEKKMELRRKKGTCCPDYNYNPKQTHCKYCGNKEKEDGKRN